MLLAVDSGTMGICSSKETKFVVDMKTEGQVTDGFLFHSIIVVVSLPFTIFENAVHFSSVLFVGFISKSYGLG